MVIETSAPISIENLKKYFTDKDITYLIDYSTSELKGKKLITYLSNLDIPADIKNIDLDLVKDYLSSVSLVSISSLENIVIDILFTMKGISKNENYNKFISENFETLEKWQNKLESLSVYNMFMLNSDHFRDYAQSFPKDETRDMEGVNFVSLLKHDRFFSFYGKINNDKLKFFVEAWAKRNQFCIDNNVWTFAEGVEMGMNAIDAGMLTQWSSFYTINHCFEFYDVLGQHYIRF